MAILAAVDLPSSVMTLIYTVPASKQAALSINLCNRTNSGQTIRLALVKSGDPENKNYIEFDCAVDGLERSGIVLDAGESVHCMASASGISIVIWGIED